MRIPDLASDRLVLRPLRPSDAPDLAKYCQDIEVSKYLAVGAPTPILKMPPMIGWKSRIKGSPESTWPSPETMP